MEERTCVLISDQQINVLIDVLKDYLHLPEVVEFHARIKKKIPRRHCQLTNTEAEIILTSLLGEISNVSGFSKEEIQGKGRLQELADVRFAFAMLSIDLYDVSDVQIKDFLGVHRSSVNYWKGEMECPQKQEIYLKLRNLLEKKPWTNK